MWQNIIPIIISSLALLASLLNLRHVKDVQKSKDLQEKFNKLEEEVESACLQIKDDLNSLREVSSEDVKEIEKKIEELMRIYIKIGAIEERLNKEVVLGERYRDKFDDKLNEIIKIIYKGER